MVRCGFKDGHQKDMCLKKTRLRAQKNASHYRIVSNSHDDCGDL